MCHNCQWDPHNDIYGAATPPPPKKTKVSTLRNIFKVVGNYNRECYTNSVSFWRLGYWRTWGYVIRDSQTPDPMFCESRTRFGAWDKALSRSSWLRESRDGRLQTIETFQFLKKIRTTSVCTRGAKLIKRQGSNYGSCSRKIPRNVLINPRRFRVAD